MAERNLGSQRGKHIRVRSMCCLEAPRASGLEWMDRKTPHPTRTTRLEPEPYTGVTVSCVAFRDPPVD
jgi:hypothetical protein